jgi:thiol peroxidase
VFELRSHPFIRSIRNRPFLPAFDLLPHASLFIGQALFQQFIISFGGIPIIIQYTEEVTQAMAQERTGVATLKGNPITLVGPELKAGDKAPDFKVNVNLVEQATLSTYAGKVKLISVVPSLDTGVCDAQTRRFNEEASKLGDNVVILTVSVDLPFAQARWCGAAGVDKVVTLSDYKERSFGTAYGVLIKELALDMRSIFVVDANDTIQYVEYLKEMTEHPNYEAAIAAVQKLV